MKSRAIVRLSAAAACLAAVLAFLVPAAPARADADGVWSELAPPAAHGAALVLDAVHGRLIAVIAGVAGEIAPQIWVRPLDDRAGFYDPEKAS